MPATVNSVRSFALGAPVKMGANFTDAGALVDPTEVSLVVTQPDGTKVTKTFGAGEIERVSQGVFKFVFTGTQPGRHYFVWEASGAYDAVDDGNFFVRPSET